MGGMYVYMLRCADGSFYVESATGDDLGPRVDQHNAGAYKGYTFTRRPVVLVWSEYFADGIAAERQLKGWSRAKRGAAPVGLEHHHHAGSATRRAAKAGLTTILRGSLCSHLRMTAEIVARCLVAARPIPALPSVFPKTPHPCGRAAAGSPRRSRPRVRRDRCLRRACP